MYVFSHLIIVYNCISTFKTVGGLPVACFTLSANANCRIIVAFQHMLRLKPWPLGSSRRQYSQYQIKPSYVVLLQLVTYTYDDHSRSPAEDICALFLTKVSH